MWCVSVPTGAFVARRNGHIFITGNSGFPKSLDVSKAIDKAAGVEREVIGRKAFADGTQQRATARAGIYSEQKGQAFDTDPATNAAREWAGWGTALKPAHEPIVMARKPLDNCTVAENCLRWGTGALNIDASRIEAGQEYQEAGWGPRFGHSSGNRASGDDRPWINERIKNGDAVKTSEAHPQGRWPADLIADGSPDVVAMFPVVSSEKRTTVIARNGKGTKGIYGDYGDVLYDSPAHPGSGSASRFFAVCPLDEGDYPPLFYCAKASKRERDEGLDGLQGQETSHGIGDWCANCGKTIKHNGSGVGCQCGNDKDLMHAVSKNHHPTVKPLSLMRYLITLCSRPGATILDPFLGSGTTGVAAAQIGRDFIGCELDPEYYAIAEARIASAQTKIELPLFAQVNT